MTVLDDLRGNFYKDGTEELHWGKIISSIIVVILLITFSIYKTIDLKVKEKERIQNARYTIGITGEKHHNIKSSQPTVEFYYTVLGKKYQSIEYIGATYEKTVLLNGGRYFVEFSSKDPTNSMLLLGLPIPDLIQSFPDSGWVDIPKTYIDNSK